MRNLVKAGALSALMLGGVQAQADVVLAKDIPNNHNPSIGTTDQYIPLGGSVNYIYFYAPVAGTYAVLYNAESAVGSGTGWLDVDVLVDGNEITPTAGDSDAQVTGDGGSLKWVKASSNGHRYLGTGWHYVQVRAKMVGSGTGWLGDSELIVMY